jgi:hypothetical protein
MNPICIPIVLIIFLILIFIPSPFPSDEKLAELIESVNKKEAVLKTIDNLYKEWDVLIEKRSQALKEMDLEKHRIINNQIDSISQKIEMLINANKSK